MPGIGKLVKNAGNLILIDKIQINDLIKLRKHLSQVRKFEQIVARTRLLRTKAFDLMNQLADQIAAYDRLARRTGRFNSYVAELLIVADHDVTSGIPIDLGYRQLQMAAHHIVLDTEHAKYAAQFKRLAEITKDGLWAESKKMPAMALFQEFHGMSPASQNVNFKMKDTALDRAKNFTPSLNKFVDQGKQTGTFAELFELHQRFYRDFMNDRFYRQKTFPAFNNKSLDDWFTGMIQTARQIDASIK